MRYRVNKRMLKPQHQMAVEIDTCIELLRKLEQVSEAGEDTSYEANALIVMRSLVQIQQLVGIPSAGSDGQTALIKNEEVQ